MGLLSLWWKRAEVAEHAHFLLATRLRRRNLWLGIPTVVVTTVVGTTAFASLQDSGGAVPQLVRILVGSVSVLAAVLAAMQTFFKFPERAERHGAAADWYAAIKRRIEQLQVLPPAEADQAAEAVQKIRDDLNHAGQTYPEIGERVWHRVATKAGLSEPDHMARWRSGGGERDVIRGETRPQAGSQVQSP
jgi:hypothetical protein